MARALTKRKHDSLRESQSYYDKVWSATVEIKWPEILIMQIMHEDAQYLTRHDGGSLACCALCAPNDVRSWMKGTFTKTVSFDFGL
eukprot:scaffold300149_cov17-Prasinocladus_malaysianus.AAC.1